jgi:DNA-binding NtrC family response regulator
MSILPEGEAVLRAHSWPGNVRELQHACESLAYLAEADQVTAADVQATLQ